MTDKEKFEFLRSNFDISHSEFRRFVALGAKAHAKIEKLQSSDLIYTTPLFISVEVGRIYSRKDFEKRVAKFEKILSPDFRIEYNKRIEKNMWDLMYDLSDGDTRLLENIYSKWKKMTVRQRKDFLDKNTDIRRVINYKDEYDEELSDLLGNDYRKLEGRLDDYGG